MGNYIPGGVPFRGRFTTHPAGMRVGDWYFNSLSKQWLQCLAVGSPGTWSSSNNSGTLSVKDFGAIGDGATDDFTSLQNAINAAPNQGMLFVPPGTYMITDRLRIPSNVHIYIAKGATIKAKSGMLDGGSIFLIWDNNAEHEVSNIVIEGEGAIDGSRGETGILRITPIVALGVHNLTIRNITIRGGQSDTGSYGDGIQIVEGNYGASEDVLIDGVTCIENDRDGIQCNAIKRCRIINCTFRDTEPLDGWNGPSAGINIDIEPVINTVSDGVTNGTTTITSATANFTQYDITKQPAVLIVRPSDGGYFMANIASITNSTTAVLDVAPDFSATGLTLKVQPIGWLTVEDLIIANNTIYNNVGGGIIVDGNHIVVPYKNLNFVNNTVRKVRDDVGISVGATNVLGLNIIGNTIEDIGTAGILVNSTNYNVNIQGNTVQNCGQYGLWLNECAHFNVIGNAFLHCGRHGIVITPTVNQYNLSSFGIIQGNQIFNNGYSSTNTYDGINILGRSDTNDTGMIIAMNQIGNDPFVHAQQPQRYGINANDPNAQNIHQLFNVFSGNLTGNINANTNAQANPILQMTPFEVVSAVGTPFSLIFHNAEENFVTGGSIIQNSYYPNDILTSDQTSYAFIAGRGEVIELRSDANGRKINSIKAGKFGETHTLKNTSAFSLVLANGGGAIDAERFWSKSGSDLTIAAGGSARIFYSGHFAAWYEI